ncbi:MAG: protein kinase [Gemmatimonadaceae bacterium]
MIDSGRWEHVCSLFDELVELNSSEQAARLEALDGSDAELRASLASLLAADSEAEKQLSHIEGAFVLSPDAHDAPAPPRDLFGLTGKTLAHFRILEPLEAGGMGVVYRAEDTRLHRTVALKFPLPGHRFDDSSKKRFLREARSVAALDHPNVCSVYEVGESADGQPFFAMPLYSGETLKARLARDGPLSIGYAVAVATQIADGLGAAHQAGIVHRDVKPGNVMLLTDGTVKLLDFGLAKGGDASLTSSRATLGTVAYMAPEQIRGQPIDGRTDLWALGVVLYETITGHRPFEGDGDVAMAHAIMHREPERPSRLRNEIPAAVEGILFALLRKTPTNRPATAQQVSTELSAVRLGRAPAPARAARQRWAALTGWRRSRASRAIAILLVTLTLSTVALSAMTRLRASKRVSPVVTSSIAVLPFTNLSEDPEQKYFSDGITEELTTHLAKVAQLRVAARRSSSHFKGGHVDLREVGRMLGVSSVLQGTVQKKGTHVRVTAQLTDAASGYHVWAETYDREISDIFLIQDEISRAIVLALRISLYQPVPARVPSTRNSEAHDLYLKGRYSWNQRNEGAMVRATNFFRQAVALDPGYAAAWSGLADVEIAPRPARPYERFARAKVAATKALALDSTLAEAHVSMSWVNMWYDRDWNSAEQHIRRAIELSPGDMWAIGRYSAYLAAVGRLQESLPLAERASALDRLSYVQAAHLGSHYLWLRREREAETQFRKALELSPDLFLAHWGLGRVYLTQGRYREALTELEHKGSDYTGLHRPGLLGYAYGLAGHEAEARRILAELQGKARRGEYVSPVDPAIIHIALGEKERALDWLERVEGDRGARIFFVDPIFDPVRSDPRFEQLVRRLGLNASLAALRVERDVPTRRLE